MYRGSASSGWREAVLSREDLLLRKLLEANFQLGQISGSIFLVLICAAQNYLFLARKLNQWCPVALQLYSEYFEITKHHMTIVSRNLPQSFASAAPGDKIVPVKHVRNFQEANLNRNEPHSGQITRYITLGVR